jgi:nitroimidazol reductase NimA-like FMN-containing flavoprotein (pyridoxamine 5'-phosphate oxidase superfamily)
MIDLTRDEINECLDAQTVGRLGCHGDGRTYVVPLIFARKDAALYILTTEGHKIRVMRKNPAVCFEVDEYNAENGNWRSAIVQGRYEELDGREKSEALAILGKRHGQRRGLPETPATTLPSVAFRIRIESATGRAVRRSS